MRRLLPLVGGVVVFAALALATVSSGGSGASPPLLVFTSVRTAANLGASANEFANLFTLRPDGRGLRRLTFVRDVERDPEWSPDGRRIVFSRGVGSDCHGGVCGVDVVSEIVVIDATGKNVRHLTHELETQGEEFRDGCPTWSPDGRQVAFVRAKTFSPDPDGGVYIVGADGRGSHRVSEALHGASPPRWSPDGTTLAFVGDERLVLLDLRTGESTYRRLSSSPSWSPDGKTLAFVANSKLALLNIGTGQVAYRGPARSVSWSPNGRWLAVTRDSGILVLPARPGAPGHRVVAMTTEEVSWSSDSRRLAFSAVQSDRLNLGGIELKDPSDLFVVGVDGRDLKRITGNPHADDAPDWRP